MTNLLVAIDDSEYTENVVRVAGRIAAGLNSDVTVFHLLTQTHGVRGPAGDHENSDQARQMVEGATALIKAGGVSNVDGRVDKGLSGDEASAILDVARELDVEIIVMGHRGAGHLSGLLIGSVAHKVIGVADRPVLVVR
jgi:nucleotide-binding universal stress UspA family protein